MPFRNPGDLSASQFYQLLLPEPVLSPHIYKTFITILACRLSFTYRFNCIHMDVYELTGGQ